MVQDLSYSKQLLDTFPPDELKQIVENIHDYAHKKEMPMISRIQGAFYTNFNKFDFDWETEGNFFNIPWKEESIRCTMPWIELRATYKGDVYPCCWGPKPLGNLKNESIESIWNNEAIHEMRSDLIDGNIPRRCSGAACPYIKGARRIDPLEWISK